MSNLITREYNGNVFTFRADGYFNMTKAAKVFGKEARFFMALDSTKEYLEALEQTVGKSHSLVETTMGRNGGTWGHPKLAVFFARWLDVKFAVFCDMVIDDIINKKAELTITKPEESAVMKLPKSFAEALRLAAELEEQKEALVAENKQLAIENEAMSEELNVLTVDEYRALSHLYLTQSQSSRLSYYAKSYCLANKIEVTKQQRFLPKLGINTYLNVYPREALDHAALVLGLI